MSVSRPGDPGAPDWRDLAYRLESADPEVRRAAHDEALEAAIPLATRLAREACRRLAHRGGTCPGKRCDHAFLSAFMEALDRIAGRDASETRSARTGLLLRWHRAARLDLPFEAFVASNLDKTFCDDVLRVWNVERDLRARFRPPKAMRVDGPGYFAAMLGCSDDLRAAAESCGLDAGEGLFRVTRALYDDACQTGLGEPIDRARVARHLMHPRPPTADLEAGIGRLAERVDSLLSAAWPAWYDDYLARARQQTRQASFGLDNDPRGWPDDKEHKDHDL